MPRRCALCNSHIINGGDCDRYNESQKVIDINDELSPISGGCNGFIPKEYINNIKKSNTFIFKIINEKKYNALTVLYDNIVINKEIGNGSNIFSCVDKDFLNIAINNQAIESVDTISIQLPIISAIDELERVVSRMEIKGGKGVIYYIHINEKILSFDETELLVINKWREKLLGECKLVMGLRSKQNRLEFDQFIALLLTNAITIWNDDESDDDILTAIVLEEINKLIMVTDKESFKRNELAYLVEEGHKLIKSSTIHQIMRNKNISISFRKLREIMRPLLSENSKQIRVNGSLVSVWFFKTVINEGGEND